MRLDHRRSKFRRAKDSPFKDRPTELPFQLAAGPAFLDAPLQVEFLFLRPLALAQDDHVLGPRQFSQQCREFRPVLPRLDKLAHPPQVLRREAADAGLPPLYVRG
jgi:hypothetical protein